MTRVLLIAVLCAGGCAEHIAPYRAKVRKFEPGAYASPRARASKHNSLYASTARGLFEDDRASRVGDVIIVRIDEAESATRKATTMLARAGDRSSSATGLLGAAASAAGLDPTSLLGASSDSKFTGSGAIERKGRLVATLPVRVQRVLPNGDLYVEGTKIIMVGNEEHHLYVSGIVRPIDIRPDNSVSSSRMAAAEIEYTGRGDVSDQQRPGWLARLLNKLMPF